jgi:hypothetical protein
MISRVNQDPDVQKRLDALQAKIPWSDDVARLEDGFMHYGRFTDTVVTPEDKRGMNYGPRMSVVARAYEHIFGQVELIYSVAEHIPDGVGGEYRERFRNRKELDAFLEDLVGSDPRNSTGSEVTFEWRDLYDDLHAIAERR